jgi:tagatose-1,6-bisphosphate aldolase non-catalytic subunit AgaZ/GatZ
VYLEEKRQLQIKAEEEKRLAQETEQQRRCETPGTWKHYFAKQEDASRRAREADLGGMIYETWPLP